MQEGQRTQTLFQWGIERHEDERIIGTCTLAGIDHVNRRAELGYALRRNCRGCGYMTEALGRLLSYSFVEMNFHCLEADVDPRNTPSIQLLERLGFRKEGHLRERWLTESEAQDSYFYGLLRSEWVKQSSSAQSPDAENF